MNKTLYVSVILALCVVVSGILCYEGRISGEQFLQVVFGVIGFIGGSAYTYYVLRGKLKEDER